MERAVIGAVIFQDFAGVEESTDPLKLPFSQTPWMHGLWPLSNHRLQRLNGKKLYDAVTTHGSLLTIQQLTFSNGTGVYLHYDRRVSFVSNMTGLLSSSPVTTPMEPFNPMDGGYYL